MGKNAKFIFFWIMAYAGVIFAQETPEFIVLRGREAGMFACFNDVLNLINSYEQGHYSGIEVNFDSGYYFEPEHGQNWWEYYCKPICLGDKNQGVLKHVNGLNLPDAISRPELRAFSREKAFEYIQKYIHFNLDIETKIKSFVKRNFKKNFIIGVHYRGTDKKHEAPRVKYKKVENEIKKHIQRLKGLRCRIFIATDEDNFLSYMQTAFPEKIIFYQEAFRSKDSKPIHGLEMEQPYKSGEAAIIDCLLLSKTDLLIRTASNLSLWSSYFNPNLPIINLNQNYIP